MPSSVRLGGCALALAATLAVGACDTARDVGQLTADVVLLPLRVVGVETSREARARRQEAERKAELEAARKDKENAEKSMKEIGRWAKCAEVTVTDDGAYVAPKPGCRT